MLDMNEWLLVRGRQVYEAKRVRTELIGDNIRVTGIVEV